MAYEQKRSGKPTGVFFGEVNRKDGTRFRRTFSTRKEAEAYEAYVKLMGTEPPAFSEDGSRVATAGRSFKEIAEACKGAGGPRGAWGANRDHSILQRLEYCVQKIGAYDIEDVTRALVRERILEPLRRLGRKQATINRYATAVSAVLTWAQQEDLIRAKPALEFRKEQDRSERSVIDFATEDAVVDWLQAQGQPVHAACVRWLAETGMRVGELYKLFPAQIRNDHVVLTAAQTKTNRPRTVYVRPELCQEMRAIVEAKRLPGRTRLLTWFKTAAKAVGCESAVCLHGLRHTRNTRLRKAGVSERVRMEILGHTSAAVNRGYDHADLDDQRAAAKAVEEMRGGGADILPFKRA